MRVSYGHTKRIWCRYQEDGDAGLVHQSRGRPGRRRKPEALRAKVLARYAQRYPDFGPMLERRNVSRPKTKPPAESTEEPDKDDPRKGNGKDK